MLLRPTSHLHENIKPQPDTAFFVCQFALTRDILAIQSRCKHFVDVDDIFHIFRHKWILFNHQSNSPLLYQHLPCSPVAFCMVFTVYTWKILFEQEAKVVIMQSNNKYLRRSREKRPPCLFCLDGLSGLQTPISSLDLRRSSMSLALWRIQ